MSTPYCYEYPRPAVTVDLVVFAPVEAGVRVLMVRRGREPFVGRLAFPGGFLDIDEPIETAARRELKEETGLTVEAPIAFLGVFGDPGRDPRGRTISLVHVVRLDIPPPAVNGGDDAASAEWVDPHGVEGMAFDHDRILARALEWLGRQG